MKLILIRHGITEANEKHLYCGKTDVPLSDNGRELLLSRCENNAYPSIDGYKILSSGLRRCEETLSVIYGNVAHKTDNDFSEMDFGKFEMKSYEELKNNPEYIEWISGNNEKNKTPEGESGELMKKRVIKAFERVRSENEDTLIITHGGVIAAIMDYLFPNENKNRYEWQPNPGEGYIIDLDADSYNGFMASS